MKRYFVILQILIFSLSLTINAQTKRKPKAKSTSKKTEELLAAPVNNQADNTAILPDESSWQEINDIQAKFKVSFPGKAIKKKSLNDFEGRDVSEVSYGLETKRALYSLNYFTLAAKVSDKKSYERIYDRFDESYLNNANSGVLGKTTKIKNRKETDINGITARETEFEDINSGYSVIREVISNGKLYYLYVSLDPKITQGDKLLIEDTKNKFFDSFQFLNK